MRILVIADPHIPVPPVQYGGAERVVALLCRQLTALGHRVDLMAGPGSKAAVGQLWIHRAPGRSLGSRAFRKIWFQFLSVIATWRADVVVNFGRLDYLEAIFRLPAPIMCVFGNPALQSEIDWVRQRRNRRVLFVGVSRAQMSTIEPKELVRVVHNATDISYFDCSTQPAAPPYLLFLGRLTANKGVDIAIDIARASGIKLIVAGNVSDEAGGKEFFEQYIQRQLGDHIVWVGPVDDAQKRGLLQGAIALLFPIRWDEPFGIVMAESLACGTPVIATRRASTPETITSGRTGFLCDSVEEMVAAVAKVRDLDRDDCRREAERRFSGEAMVRRYLEVIQELTDQST